MVQAVHRHARKARAHRPDATRDRTGTFLAATLCSTLLLCSCAVNQKTTSDWHAAAAVGETLQRAWNRMEKGHYRMVVAAEREGSVQAIRQVEAWWDTHADLLRIEERSAQGALIWLLLRKGLTVWSVDVPRQQAQQLELKQTGTFSLIARLHPYSALWRKASLTSVQELSVDPLRLSVWAAVRTNERLRQMGDKVVYTWEHQDGFAQVSAELQADSLLPLRCEVTYASGKRLVYTYTILAQRDIPESVHRLPTFVSVEVQRLDSPLELGEKVTLLRPAVPDSAREGAGEPDRFAGGYTDWLSEIPHARRFASPRELFSQTGIRLMPLPARWGKPDEIIYVWEAHLSSVPPLEVARLTFRKGSAEEFRLEVQQLPAGYSSMAERVLAYGDKFVTVGGRRVGILSPDASYSPAWIATWYDAQRYQIVSLYYIGSEEAFLRLVKEMLAVDGTAER